jgi:hypothetical protein
MRPKPKSHTVIRNSNLFCPHCGKEQIIAYPISTTMFSAICTAFSKIHKSCSPVWKQPEPDMSQSKEERMQWWLKHGERGRSAETIFTVLSGDSTWLIPKNEYDNPHDPDDFRRCYMLLKAIPEWKADLHNMINVSKVWRNLAENWDKLEAMLEEQMKTQTDNGMYDFMHSLGC